MNSNNLQNANTETPSQTLVEKYQPIKDRSLPLIKVVLQTKLSPVEPKEELSSVQEKVQRWVCPDGNAYILSWDSILILRAGNYLSLDWNEQEQCWHSLVELYFSVHQHQGVQNKTSVT